jgi:hypothetical protein
MRTGFDHISLAYCIPYPGSELFERYVTGPIDDWDKFIHFNPFQMSEIPPGELTRWMRRAVLLFYANPARAWGLLKKISPRRLPSVVKLLYKYLSK